MDGAAKEGSGNGPDHLPHARPREAEARGPGRPLPASLLSAPSRRRTQRSGIFSYKWGLGQALPLTHGYLGPTGDSFLAFLSPLRETKRGLGRAWSAAVPTPTQGQGRSVRPASERLRGAAEAQQPLSPTPRQGRPGDRKKSAHRPEHPSRPTAASPTHRRGRKHAASARRPAPGPAT